MSYNTSVNASIPSKMPHIPRFRVLIDGFGLISPLGISAWQTFSTLLAGRTLTERTENLPDNCDPIDLVKVVGAVTSAQHTAADPVVELAERAAREAAMAAGIQTKGLPAFVGTSRTPWLPRRCRVIVMSPGSGATARASIALTCPSDLRKLAASVAVTLKVT